MHTEHDTNDKNEVSELLQESSGSDAQAAPSHAINRRSFLAASAVGSAFVAGLGVPKASAQNNVAKFETSFKCFFTIKLVDQRNVRDFFSNQFYDELNAAIREYEVWMNDRNMSINPLAGLPEYWDNWTIDGKAGRTYYVEDWEAMALIKVKEIQDQLETVEPQTLTDLFSMDRPDWDDKWDKGTDLRNKCKPNRAEIFIPFYDVPSSLYGNEPHPARVKCSDILRGVAATRNGTPTTTKTLIDVLGDMSFHDVFFSPLEGFGVYKYDMLKKGKESGILRLHSDAIQAREASAQAFRRFKQRYPARQLTEAMELFEFEELDEYLLDYINDLDSAFTDSSDIVTFFEDQELEKGKCAMNTAHGWVCNIGPEEYQCALDEDDLPLSGSDFCP